MVEFDPTKALDNSYDVEPSIGTKTEGDGTPVIPARWDPGGVNVLRRDYLSKVNEINKESDQVSGELIPSRDYLCSFRTKTYWAGVQPYEDDSK